MEILRSQNIQTGRYAFKEILLREISGGHHDNFIF